MEHFFDIRDAKGYVLLKDSRKKVATDEVIDVRPYLMSEEQRLAKHQRRWTPESVTRLPPDTPKKRRQNKTQTKPKPTQTYKKKSSASVGAPSRRESIQSESSGPRLSEYEKMQLLIADATNEANTPASRTRRHRETPTAESHSIKSLHRHSAKPSTITKPKERKVLDSQINVSLAEKGVCVREVVPTPTSPKIAVYDEWQKLLKNAQKEGEAGLGRSRRASRRPLPDNDLAESPPKRRRKVSPRKGSIEGSDDGIPSTVDDNMLIDESSVDISKPTNYDALQDIVRTAEKEVKEIKDYVTGAKTRRNIRSLEGDEIFKVKSEMATVQARYLNIPSKTDDSQYLDTIPRDAKSKEQLVKEERPVLTLRKSQTPKSAEAELLKENRLFMFAILATEGIMGNTKTNP
jgi:hypothetical protein